MPYLYLILSVFTSASSTVFGKLYNKQNDKKDATVFYNFLLMLSVFLGWGILYAVNFSFEAGVLRYSVLFSACYICCNLGIINALKYGSAMLTTLFNSLSCIMTTVWGFFFWDVQVTIPVIVGLILVVIAFVLCLYTKGKDEKVFSWKWLFYVSIGFLGNAGCAIVQRTQQMQYNGKHGNMLMLFAMAIATLIYVFVYFKSDRRDTPVLLKEAWWMPVCAGIGNLLLNVFVLLMAVTDLSPGLIYPVVAVGSLAVVTVFSLLVFKEKMRWWQWIGMALGTVAVVLLSI